MLSSGYRLRLISVARGHQSWVGCSLPLAACMAASGAMKATLLPVSGVSDFEPLGLSFTFGRGPRAVALGCVL